MTITGKYAKLLDDKESFFLWLELGSTAKVAAHMQKEGRVNPRSQHSFTPMAIWDSAMRWVLTNPEEAREIYVAHGDTRTQGEWEEWLVLKAMHVVGTSRGRFMKWIYKNDFEKYSYIYGEKYPPIIIS